MHCQRHCFIITWNIYSICIVSVTVKAKITLRLTSIHCSKKDGCMSILPECIAYIK